MKDTRSTVNKSQGKLVVFEGTDGSGKTTQAKLLLKYLQKNKIPSVYISFPRYETKWGKIIRKFLDGGMGNLGPYDTSIFYANDRKSAAVQIIKWIEVGKIVVCNRYIGSNIGHMAAKFPKIADRKEYIGWLEKLEYGQNKIPKEDLVVLLQLPPTISRKLMKSRILDIHEKYIKYQEDVYKVYSKFASSKGNWVKVNCTKGGKILSPAQIHNKVIEVMTAKKIIPARGATSGSTRGRSS